MNWLFGCKCAKRPNWVIANEHSKSFNSMQEVKAKRNAFTVLKKCKKCGQHWQVDVDYKSLGFAIKINDAKNWLSLSDFQSRKEAIIEHHGGISSQKCRWNGCDNNALLDMVFCVSCAYTHMHIYR